ncbi:MAG: phosphoenolpyruvate--protein phosphotransferase [Chlamydiia bacterium]|nr:phosphoenolpyruvate--protein phosphotransferase [Chlamydiia bacterium]
MTLLQERDLSGITLSKGVAMAPLFFFSSLSQTTPSFKTLSPGQEEGEFQRFKTALNNCYKDLETIRSRLKTEDVQKGVVAILDSHLQMIRDPGLLEKTRKKIFEHLPAEYAFRQVIEEYLKRFNKIKDPFFKERAYDVKDVATRVERHLLKDDLSPLDEIIEPSILFMKEASSTLVAELSPLKVAGLITESGSETSHAAILARAKGIPYLSGIRYKDLVEEEGERVILDGFGGKVIVNPSLESLNRFLAEKQRRDSLEGELDALRALKAETFDGYRLRLSANIDLEGELDLLHRYGGDGVGLFRSEIAFLKESSFPDEEAQYRIYKSIVDSMKGLPLVIRTFDIGGDKGVLPVTVHEENPYLGSRAIRFLLKEKLVFKTQLRAILRAAHGAQVSVMFPMISGLSEIKEAKALLAQVEKELEQENIPFKKNIGVGSMVEVPSAAILSDLIAKECDFISIGTNDLVQYSLAVDRGSDQLSEFYTPTHPGVIRLIKTVVSEANRQGIPVTVCGEIAADPRFVPLLLGLGVHELSVSARHIPYVKQEIRKTGIVRAARLAEEVLNLDDPEEIARLLEHYYTTL